MNDMTITIGSPSQGLAITIMGRSNADRMDCWDGNWLTTTVDIAVGGFRGGINGLIRAEELVAFHDQIKQLHNSPEGHAVFSTMEGWISLQFDGDKMGHINCKGYVKDQPGSDNSLSFQLDLDQTYLPDMLRSIGAVVAAFPVRGTP